MMVMQRSRRSEASIEEVLLQVCRNIRSEPSQIFIENVRTFLPKRQIDG